MFFTFTAGDHMDENPVQTVSESPSSCMPIAA